MRKLIIIPSKALSKDMEIISIEIPIEYKHVEVEDKSEYPEPLDLGGGGC